MVTTIDKAGRVVIPAAVRKRAGFAPGTQLDVSADEFGVRISRRAASPCLRRVDGRLLARPTAPQTGQPKIDPAAWIEAERNRWP